MNTPFIPHIFPSSIPNKSQPSLHHQPFTILRPMELFGPSEKVLFGLKKELSLLITVNTRFCTYDLIKEDDWCDHPCTKKKIILALHASFVFASHASICSCITCINSFIAYHKNDPEILIVATVFPISKLNHRIERYRMIKFARSTKVDHT